MMVILLHLMIAMSMRMMMSMDEYDNVDDDGHDDDGSDDPDGNKWEVAEPLGLDVLGLSAPRGSARKLAEPPDI
eukprot:4900751-Karenia_brevis.AAC.1